MDTDKAAILSKLTLHFWRPDFGPGQVKLLVQDYLDDLAAYSTQQVFDACTAYRKAKDSKFFPTSGQLIALIEEGIRENSNHCRLPTFQRLPELEAPRAVKSVYEILKENGHDKAAEGWVEWKKNRPK